MERIQGCDNMTYPPGDHRSETCAPRPFWSIERYSDCPQRCASWPPADPASWSGWTALTASWWPQDLPRLSMRAMEWAPAHHRRTCVQSTRTQSWRRQIPANVLIVLTADFAFCSCCYCPCWFARLLPVDCFCGLDGALSRALFAYAAPVAYCICSRISSFLQPAPSRWNHRHRWFFTFLTNPNLWAAADCPVFVGKSVK